MADERPPNRGTKRWVFVGVLVAGAVAGGGWLLSSRNDARGLRIVVSGDTAGWLIPCGCASNQSGGLLRRGTFVRHLRAERDVVVLDVGGAAAGLSPYHQTRFEAILDGERVMGVHAHNIGASEAAFGADYLRDLARAKGIPFISANLRDSNGAPVADAMRIVEAGGQNIGIVGVLSRQYVADGLLIEDPLSAVMAAVADHEGRLDSLMVLAYLPEDELRMLASRLPEADVVIGGPTGQNLVPSRTGPTLLISATNKAKFLMCVDRERSGDIWQWSARPVEMSDAYEDDPDQVANLNAYLARLDERDFSAAQTGLVPLLDSGVSKMYRVAGQEACRECHPKDAQSWDESMHALAWRMLEQQGKHVDPYCQQCHTTGYGLPGGFESARRSPSRVNVGCESCHGPAQAHVDDPQVKTPFDARDQCVRCHDEENSPAFDYDPYWQRIDHGVEAVNVKTRSRTGRLP